MIARFDFDSLIYIASYKIYDDDDMKIWKADKRSDEWIEREIVELIVNRVHNMIDNILISMEDAGLEILDSRYYITTCKNSIRKKYYPEYKANRPYNELKKWASLVRDYVSKEMNFAIGHDEYEADDLICDETEEGDVIVTLDKDLNQIGGLFFDFYRVPVYDENKQPVLNQYGQPQKEYRGFKMITSKEAKRFYYRQLIIGDPGDNIKGAYLFGKGTVDDILDSCDHEKYEDLVTEIYYKAEVKKLKSEINKTNSKLKKMNFETFFKHFHSDEFDLKIINRTIKRANRELALNKLLIGLGTKGREPILKILDE